jgi:hypothetical protein
MFISEETRNILIASLKDIIETGRRQSNSKTTIFLGSYINDMLK